MGKDSLAFVTDFTVVLVSKLLQNEKKQSSDLKLLNYFMLSSNPTGLVSL